MWGVSARVPPVSAPMDPTDGAAARAAAARRGTTEVRAWAFDVAMVVMLAVTAFAVRRHTMPTNGLWFDDAWVSAGATRASFGDLFTVSNNQPGFAAALMLWGRVVGRSATAMAVPALIAGVVGPPALFVLLRRLGFRRAVSALLAAALVGASVHVAYSGRVKSYVIDPLIVIGLAAVLPALVGRRWRWPLAAVWVAASVVLSSISVFALLVFAVAGLLLASRPHEDRTVRLVAIATQVLLQACYVLVVQHAYDSSAIRAAWDHNYDAYLKLNANPVHLARELLHVGRLAPVFPGRTGWFGTVCVLVALGGLAWAAFSRPHPVVPVFLGLSFLVALCGSIVHQFPLTPATGPRGFLGPSPGQRVALWTVPILAVGLAVVLTQVERSVTRRQSLRRSFDIAVYALALLALVTAFHQDRAYPERGTASAARYVSRHVRPHDVVLIGPNGEYEFANETDFPVTMTPNRQSEVGFDTKYRDPRVHDVLAPAAVLGREVAGTSTIYIFESVSWLLPMLAPQRWKDAQSALRIAGFREDHVVNFNSAAVGVWVRAGYRSNA